MSRSLNKVQLIGNLGADPEMRSTTTGVRLAKLRIATTRRWNDRQGQPQEKTEWHNVTCWDKLAEICERYLKRGAQVYVEGSIEYSQLEGKDGQTKYFTDIRARELIMLGGRDGGGDQAQSRSSTAAPSDDSSDFSNESLAGEDDLPF
ncbi:MAG: single-stranded DNA-binding protein [Gemmatimonadales bacterium]|nr:MAG: single-stranded DNA-binding protein [Gemmatimonadales bacterium]